MSKLVDKYLILKKENPNKIYLFRCGKFYIFLDEDCNFINDYVVLKKTPFTKDVMKCGFPNQSLDDYLRVFHNLNLDIEVIEDETIKPKDNDIIKKIKELDLESTTPIEAFQFLIKIKEKL